MLLDIFNLTNKTAIEPWQVTFGEPEAVVDQAPQLSVVHLNDYDNHRPAEGTLTRIAVTPTPESGWRGVQHLTYRRQVLQDFFISVPFVIYAVENTPEVILNALREQYDFYLDMDLVDITFRQVDLSNVLFRTHMGSILASAECSDYVPPVAWNAIITAKPNHPLWVGEINVYIREAVQFLDRNVKTTLEVRRYLGPEDHHKMPAEMILPNDRFVDHDHLMRDLKVGELVGEWIVDSAKRITQDAWVFTQTANPFNLYGAKVVYNGLNTGEVYIDDPRVSRVLIIQFSDTHCTNLRGQWVMGYYDSRTWERRTRIDHLPIQDQ